MPNALEICIACDTPKTALQNALAAADGGADRLECCAAMNAGGLTPAPSIIEAIRNAVPTRVAVLAMLRPRDGAFTWSAKEAQILKQSGRELIEAGADGIVSGALTDGIIDTALTEALISMAHDAHLPFTFHRAIDAATDRLEALETLLALGCDRVLTAGTAWGEALGATDGLGALHRSARHVQGRMEIVVGGGVSATSLPALLEALQPYDNLSFHAYSSVLENGITNASKVSVLRRMLDA